MWESIEQHTYTFGLVDANGGATDWLVNAVAVFGSHRQDFVHVQQEQLRAEPMGIDGNHRISIMYKVLQR